MSGTPLLYGIRRLNPFQGMVQIAELGDARALSLDGVRWEIQVRCAQPEHTWRSANRGKPVLRFLRFGSWSREFGLRQVPVSPILDLDLLFGASEAMVQVLPDFLDALPFAPADRYERWLLDPRGVPLALLASEVRASAAKTRRAETWVATARSDHSFRSSHLARRGVPVRHGPDPRYHASLLERLVRDSAPRPARSSWFVRGVGDGQGSIIESQPAKNDEDSWPLVAEALPSLPLREDWPDPSDRDLVWDYLDWCAPYLLTLFGLSETQRDRFEHAAKARALEVEALHRLYPMILNPGLFKSVRVEARMRRSRIA